MQRSMQINHSIFHVSTTTADFRQIYEDQPQQISCRPQQISCRSMKYKREGVSKLVFYAQLTGVVISGRKKGRNYMYQSWDTM